MDQIRASLQNKILPERPEIKRNKERNLLRLRTQNEFMSSDHKAVWNSSTALINSLQLLMGD